jgi:hypothetical protein
MGKVQGASVKSSPSPQSYLRQSSNFEQLLKLVRGEDWKVGFLYGERQGELKFPFRIRL